MLYLCTGTFSIAALFAFQPGPTAPSLAPSLEKIAHALEQAQPAAPTWTPTLVIAVVGVLIALLTAGIGLYNFGVSPARLKRHEIRLQYVEQQLSKLYGPLFAECIKSDSIFRRVELMFNKQEHHHDKDFVGLDLAQQHDESAEPNSIRSRPRTSLLSWAVRKIYLPSNKRKVALLSNNLHLFGPYPPLSFYLFMTHSAQMQGLMQLKQEFTVYKPDPPAQDAGNSAPKKAGKDPTNDDPYMLVPFPFILTAEVAAKVALLKALQREWRHRIGQHRDPGEVFSRQAYYLLLHDPQSADCLNWVKDYGYNFEPTDTIRDVMNKVNKRDNYFIASCPLLWGPYTGIEVLELRSWLINKEIPARAMNNLQDQRMFYAAMLHAAVVMPADRSEGTSPESFPVPLHYRVTQAFDEIDQSGSKSGFSWNPRFAWSDLGEPSAPQLATRFKWYRPAKSNFEKTYLKDLQNPEGFAYSRRRFEKMSEESGFKRRLWSDIDWDMDN